VLHPRGAVLVERRDALLRRSGLFASVVAFTKAVIALFVGPSFHEGSGFAIGLLIRPQESSLPERMWNKR